MDIPENGLDKSFRQLYLKLVFYAGISQYEMSIVVSKSMTIDHDDNCTGQTQLTVMSNQTTIR